MDMGDKFIMTIQKKITFALLSLVAVIAIGVGTALALHHGFGQPSMTPTQQPALATSEIEIPATAEEQNKKGDEAFNNATSAIRNADKAEAKKQFANALKLYTAADNKRGIEKVLMSAQAAEDMPDPVTPNPATVSPAQ